MKSLFAVIAAALILPSVGCQSMGSFGQKSPMAMPSHVTQSQRAPRPTIFRSANVQTAGLAGQMQNMPETGMFQRCGYNCGCGEACGNGGCCGNGGGCGNGGCYQGGGGCMNGACGNGGCRGGACGGNGGCCNGNGLINHAVGSMLDCAQTDASYNFNQGPAVAQTAYPYYSVKGPRDFLMKNPPTIGPGAYSPNCPY
jgi:hypothetical protein